ncbi:uncharacterized protein CIMG_13551 [Coccidioides immitis RS]|uniref:Uncharacterized protein n=1 Tax=Coccidioides immitis (strain RS) TaxID=246410 RepID=A0A0E1S007_COCIM|nr:uncharacterized protein CIMG_13551 [Coccidioides immitis RS]EAS27554.2 hypothetical protein CIMG_13551 [Coccidioides immitis RS]
MWRHPPNSYSKNKSEHGEYGKNFFASSKYGNNSRAFAEDATGDHFILPEVEVGSTDSAGNSTSQCWETQELQEIGDYGIISVVPGRRNKPKKRTRQHVPLFHHLRGFDTGIVSSQ